MIYFDNAATGGFKPHAVCDITNNVVKYLCANPARSAHRLAVTAGEIVYSTREKLADLFDGAPERVVFTKNCTEAINLGIFGTVKKGGKVITTTFEHNSVLRPLYYLQRLGLINLEILSPTQNEDIFERIERRITPDTYLVCATAVSNVTGYELPIRKIGKLLKEKNILFLVDGAQGCGHVPLSIKQDNISMLAFAGHKGLYGIMGSGGLIFSEDVEITPTLYGGSGVDTFNLDMPLTYPERLEAGTLNLPAIASLKEGVDYIKPNLKHFSAELYKTTQKVIESLAEIPNLKIYSYPNCSGIISFAVNGQDSQTVSDILGKDYDIAVRGGFHCAPLTHRFLGTENEGLTRVSLAVQNSAREISTFLSAMTKICRGLNTL